MAAYPDDSSFDDTASSLGDSAYEFIDDKSVVTSDDDDHGPSTQSSSSNDEQDIEHDHIRRTLHSTAFTEVGQREIHPNEIRFSSESGHSSKLEGACREDESTTLINEGYPGQIPGNKQDRQPSIEFEEPKTTGVNTARFIDVSRTLKVFQEYQIPEMFTQNRMDPPPKQVVANIRQTMTSGGLSPEEPYKVLYIGHTSAKESIIQKLGTALAVSLKTSTLEPEKARSSKFNVIPISSFGDGTSPEVVLIDSTGLELSVEDCASASFARRDGGNDTIRMTLSDQTLVESSWLGSKFVTSNNWALPDLAVFYLSDNDGITTKQTRRFARSLMARHNVPSIVISQTPLWSKPTEAITLDYMTPHLCLESNGSGTAKCRVVKRLPIDLSTFLDLDAGQMNRNLACLAVAQGPLQSRHANSLRHQEAVTVVGEDPHVPFGISKASKYIRTHIPPEIRSLVACSSVLFLAIIYLAAAFSLQRNPILSIGMETMKNIATTPGSSACESIASLRSISVSSTPGIIPSMSSSLPAQSSLIRSISTVHSNTDLASFLLDPHTLAPNKSENFKVHVIGDCHIVLRPPHWFTRLRKAPKLSFKVTRKDAVMEHQVSTLFDGVYALKVSREDAHGTLNVTVWTTTKPKITESFQVDFGTPWLKVAGWMKAAQVVTRSMREDLNSAQTSLSIYYSNTSTELQTLMQYTVRKAIEYRKEARKIGLTSLKETTRTTDLLVEQATRLTRDVSEKIGRGVIASKELSLQLATFRHNVATRARETTSIVSRQTRLLSQATSVQTLKAISRGVQESSKTHLRKSQKSALKFWWKISGLPKKRASNNMVNRATHTHKHKSKRGGSR
ncbi:hypothetical protein MMC12_006774 [Toensbergia leucococca]|nr:hypothetical protein [Toensbergia leucococca]